MHPAINLVGKYSPGRNIQSLYHDHHVEMNILQNMIN